MQLDYAQSSGPGYDSLYSVDGGLILDTRAAKAGTGRAAKFDANIDLADINADLSGYISGYAEMRDQGLSTLDLQVKNSTGDQRLYGFNINQTLESRLQYGLHFDRIDDEIGTDVTQAGVELAWPISPTTTLAVGADCRRETAGGVDTARLDVAARLTHKTGENGSI